MYVFNQIAKDVGVESKDIKNMTKYGVGEFLRLRYDCKYISGSGVRTLMSFISGNWESSALPEQIGASAIWE